jgi:hypothetical protein
MWTTTIRLPNSLLLEKLSHSASQETPRLLSNPQVHYSVRKIPIQIRGCIQKFPDWVDNEINNNKHLLRSNTKGYGGKTHCTDSQNSDTIAPSGRKLYHLQFSLQGASPKTSGYTLVRTRKSQKVRAVTVYLRSNAGSGYKRREPSLSVQQWWYCGTSNMAAPLTECGQRGASTGEISEGKLEVSYGQRAVNEWVGHIQTRADECWWRTFWAAIDSNVISVSGTTE